MSQDFFPSFERLNRKGVINIAPKITKIKIQPPSLIKSEKEIIALVERGSLVPKFFKTSERLGTIKKAARKITPMRTTMTKIG